MGLTVVSIAESLFPLAANAAQAVSNGSLGGNFASLLAGLLGGGSGAGTDAQGEGAAAASLADPASTLSTPGKHAPGAPGDDVSMSMLAALFAQLTGPTGQMPALPPGQAQRSLDGKVAQLADGHGGPAANSTPAGLASLLAEVQDMLAGHMPTPPGGIPSSAEPAGAPFADQASDAAVPALPLPAVPTEAGPPLVTRPIDAALPTLDPAWREALAGLQAVNHDETGLGLGLANVVPKTPAATGPAAATTTPQTLPPTEADPLPSPGANLAPPGPAPSPDQVSVARFDGDAQTNAEAPRLESAGKPESASGAALSASAAGDAGKPPVELATSPAATEQLPVAGRFMDFPPAVRQVARALVERLSRGGGEAQVRLDPPELGEVTIHVKLHGGQVEVEVRAERPEAAQLLREHANDLSSLLSRHGMELHVDVQSGGAWGQHRRPHQDGDAATGRQRPVAGQFADLLGIGPAVSAADLGSRLRAAYNPDGIHLYRI